MSHKIAPIFSFSQIRIIGKKMTMTNPNLVKKLNQTLKTVQRHEEVQEYVYYSTGQNIRSEEGRIRPIRLRWKIPCGFIFLLRDNLPELEPIE